jgi:hypothetical protein
MVLRLVAKYIQDFYQIEMPVINAIEFGTGSKKKSCSG